MQTKALQQEAAIAKAAKDVEKALMSSAVTSMKNKDKEKELKKAKEKGEEFAPDGTPIPENQNNGIRPLDPRTPVTFGDPFARVNDVDEEINDKLAKGNLSSEELSMIEKMKKGKGNESASLDYEDEFDTMLVIDITPRHMCGISEAQASETCGPTCDPNYKYCTMGSFEFPGHVDFLKSDGQVENWGTCHEDVLCSIKEDHELILDESNECRTRKIHNPCPNPCDCFKNKNKQKKCKELCSRTDSVSIIACQLERKRGKRRRERKVARKLDSSKACSFNVYYEHPLMHSEGLEKETLPGLFGTF